jgi:urease accessory protein
MKSASFSAIAAASITALTAQTAGAHSAIFHTGGLAVGFAHPFLGLDHVLAMIAVGVWAAQCGGRARIALPAAFIAAIAAGGVLAMTGTTLPHIEAGIAATVLALGLLIALAVRLPVFVGAALAATFALWHGFRRARRRRRVYRPMGDRATASRASARRVRRGSGRHAAGGCIKM